MPLRMPRLSKAGLGKPEGIQVTEIPYSVWLWRSAAGTMAILRKAA